LTMLIYSGSSFLTILTAYLSPVLSSSQIFTTDEHPYIILKIRLLTSPKISSEILYRSLKSFEFSTSLTLNSLFIHSREIIEDLDPISLESYLFWELGINSKLWMSHRILSYFSAIILASTLDLSRFWRLLHLDFEAHWARQTFSWNYTPI
jgi:hypothetical protein